MKHFSKGVLKCVKLFHEILTVSKFNISSLTGTPFQHLLLTFLGKPQHSHSFTSVSRSVASIFVFIAIKIRIIIQ